MTLLGGCATSDKPVVAVRPNLPPLPATLKTDCVDPGVRDIDNIEQAVDVIGANRLYAACEKRKHRGTTQFYEDVKTRYGM